MKSISSDHTIENSNGTLYYSKFGNGSKKIILFHGFGQDRMIFKKLIDELSETHTLFSFDLFFHGQSGFEEKFVTKSDWKEFFDAFLKREGLTNFSMAA